MKHLNSLSVWVIAAVAIAALTGCQSQSPEENPTIKAALEEVDSNTETLDILSDKLVDLDNEVTALNADVSTLKKNVGGAQHSAKTAELEKRLNALEKNLEELAAKGTAKARVQSVSTKLPKQEVYSKPKGYYYTVKKDDTISGIARSTGVSVSDILTANHLNASSKIYPGNKIFIPYPDVK